MRQILTRARRIDAVCLGRCPVDPVGKFFRSDIAGFCDGGLHVCSQCPDILRVPEQLTAFEQMLDALAVAGGKPFLTALSPFLCSLQALPKLRLSCTTNTATIGRIFDSRLPVLSSPHVSAPSLWTKEFSVSRSGVEAGKSGAGRLYPAIITVPCLPTMLISIPGCA
jgi:hypothetical protein